MQALVQALLRHVSVSGQSLSLLQPGSSLGTVESEKTLLDNVTQIILMKAKEFITEIKVNKKCVT